MACKKVIVLLPPAIPRVSVSPADIRAFIRDMIPAMREVIAANPLTIEYEMDGDYILQAFIKFILAPSKTQQSQSRWEKYDREFNMKGKKPYPTWFLNRLNKYLYGNRATLANLPMNPFKPWTGRPVPQLSRTKLIVIYLRPSDVYLPTRCLNLDDDVGLPLAD